MNPDQILETIQKLRAMGATSIEIQGVKVVFPPLVSQAVEVRLTPEQEQAERKEREEEDLYAAT